MTTRGATPPSDLEYVELVTRNVKRVSTIELLSYIEQDTVALRQRIETGKGEIGNLPEALRIRIYSAELYHRGY